jgi:hypothetical protein
LGSLSNNLERGRNHLTYGLLVLRKVRSRFDPRWGGAPLQRAK